MSAKFTFQLTSSDRKRPLGHKVLIAQGPNESVRHVSLKLLAWLLFHRERLQIETEVPNDAIPFVPDLVELGYDLRPLLWIECGDCGVAKLHKVATRCPEADIWILKRAPQEARRLLDSMRSEELRQGRYGIIAFEPAFFDELCGQLRERNQLHWFGGSLEPAAMQFDLNNLWFDTTFEVFRH